MFLTDRRCTVCQRLVQIPHHFSITSYLLHSPTEKPFPFLTILTWARPKKNSETSHGEVLWLWAGGDQLNIYSNLGSHSFWKAYLLGPIVTNSKSMWFLTFSIVIPKTALLSNLDISYILFKVEFPFLRFFGVEVYASFQPSTLLKFDYPMVLFHLDLFLGKTSTPWCGLHTFPFPSGVKRSSVFFHPLALYHYISIWRVPFGLKGVAPTRSYFQVLMGCRYVWCVLPLHTLNPPLGCIRSCPCPAGLLH